MNLKANDLRKGYVIKWKDRPCRVVSAVHHTPGNLRAMVQVDMKDLTNGTNMQYRFRSEDVVEKLNLDVVEMEYLYQEGENYVFMDTKNYEQSYIPSRFLEDSAGYLLPNSKVSVSFIEGKPVSVEIPARVTLKVVETEPGIKNATATNVLKPAVLETGIKIGVPPFINEGDSIIVNTETGEYMSRA
jgi:elongation factor P